MDLSNFQLTYDDEFNSFTSSPDGSQGYQTTYYFGGRSLGSNGEQEYYSDSSVGVNPFSLQNGELTITASPGSNPDGLPYNSGLITTEGDFSQTYGYFEMRAELPQGQGMWPAFWMLPTDKSWPPEIDVLEAFGAPNGNGDGGTNHSHVNAITSDWASGGGGDWVNMPNNGDISSGYHTYGVDWEPDHITWYIDGQQVYQTNTPSDMHKPMYMLANLAAGGSWPGAAGGETGQMHIDYIRAYSSDPNAHAVAMQQVSSPDGADTGGNSTDAAPQAATASDPAAGTDTGSNATDAASQAAIASDGTAAATSGTDTASTGSTSSTSDSSNHSATDGTAAAASGTDATSTGSTSGTGGSSDHSANLTLHVSEDAWNGDAQFTVSVDGHQVGGVQTATASHADGQWQDIALAGNFDSGPHTVAVDFVNDSSGPAPGQDRNLYVQSVEINGQHIDGNTADNSAAHGAESMDSSAAVMVANGEAVFHAAGTTDGTTGAASGTGSIDTGSTGTGTADANATGTNAAGTSSLTLHVSEDAWNGDAQFVVTVDGHQVGGVQTATASHSAGQVQDITLTGDFGSTGPGSVGVHFLNDAWGGTADTDRNLYVQGLDVNGTHIDGNAATNDAANGYASADPTAAVMDVNGTATFDVHHNASPDLLLG